MICYASYYNQTESGILQCLNVITYNIRIEIYNLNANTIIHLGLKSYYSKNHVLSKFLKNHFKLKKKLKL